MSRCPTSGRPRVGQYRQDVSEDDARSATRSAPFSLERSARSVEDFHHRPIEPGGRRLWIPHLPDLPTLVLGSAQRESTLDHAAIHERGIPTVRRRSGGGAVLVSARDIIWFDVLIDRGDPLWDDDVGRAFLWLGEAIGAGLSRLGHRTELHTGSLVTTPWSDRVCFAGLGPGELTVDGKKCVGISQRRSRDVTRLQAAVLRQWSGETHAALVASPTNAVIDDLHECAVGIPDTPETVLDTIFDELPGHIVRSHSR